MIPFLFGWPLMGTVDRVDDEAIRMRFIVLGVPLFPTKSYFVIGSEPHFKLATQKTLNSPRYQRLALPIKLNRRSVLVGYLRGYAWLPALLFCLSAPPKWFGFAGTAYTALGLLVVCYCYTLFWLGRINPRERERRRTLRRTTGIGIDSETIGVPIPPELITLLRQREAAKTGALHAFPVEPVKEGP